MAAYDIIHIEKRALSPHNKKELHMPTLKLKAISSLEKCFYNDDIDALCEKKDFIIFKNERLTFQVAFLNTTVDRFINQCPVVIKGDLAKYTTVRQVTNVPVAYPAPFVRSEGEYIKKEPGLYPDLIRPLMYDGAITVPYNNLGAIWVEVDPKNMLDAGEYTLKIALNTRSGEELAATEVNIRIINATLPEQELIHTEWFYTDCIAQHYHVRAFSEKHWKLIESFMRCATKNGVNMILTPVFTPELDTYIGGERLTTQLVDITVLSKDKYGFSFEKLHRWIDLALDCGYKYFEIPHFFTQWGSKHAPKFVAKVNGKTKRIFGWETNAQGEEYEIFLSQFIPALISEFKARGLDKKCFFHVSDEPHMADLEQYTACKNILKKYLDGYTIIDALSDFEFYKSGALEKPVPHTKDITPFIEAGVPGLWAYYCASGAPVADRFIAMPTARTRILGVQLYLYNIEGYLHWGYNYYNNKHSYDVVDPYGTTDGGFWVPAGDTFLVYPGSDGKPWESLRLNALREAVDDIRALRAYEAKFGRAATEDLIYEGVEGRVLDFTNYPTNPAYLISLRERIARALA